MSTPTGEAVDETGRGRDLVQMLRSRLRPLRYYVEQEKKDLAVTVASYVDVLSLPADMGDEHRISRDVGRTFAVFGERLRAMLC